ncbi:MAG TPA: hypothetical protein VGR21_05925, partial [Cryptosporangiaceae bacterium]|nr:hypothetical protein [Cryptosporangiaceae bacterium]
MDVGRFVRWAGAAGIVGGVLWTISIVIHALRPVGCVADGCAVRPMRESSAVEGILTLGAFLLFSVAGAALVVLVR